MSNSQSSNLLTLRVEIKVLGGWDHTGQRVRSKGKRVRLSDWPQPQRGKALEKKSKDLGWCHPVVACRCTRYVCKIAIYVVCFSLSKAVSRIHYGGHFRCSGNGVWPICYNRIRAIAPGEKQRKRASWEAQDLIWGIVSDLKQKRFWLDTEPLTKNHLTDSESNQRWFEPLPQKGPASSLTARLITSYCLSPK